MRQSKNLWIHLQKIQNEVEIVFGRYMRQKSRAKAKLVKDDNIFLPGASSSRDKQKGGTSSPSCRPVSIGLLLRVFHKNVSTGQSCPFKLLERRRKTLCCRGIFLSPPVVCRERHRRYSLPIPRTILTGIWIELCNFVICAKPYAGLHEIRVHSNLKIETAYNWKDPRKDETRLVLYKNPKVNARRRQTCPHREAFKVLFIKTFLAITEKNVAKI